jgi:hypothetical protein
MKLRPVSAKIFREDDTFVAVFAFVHLRERVAGRQSPGHTHRISFSRGAHEAGAWGTGGFRSAGSLFSCQVCGRPRLRAHGTIVEHLLGVKCVWRDLLDMRLPARAPQNHCSSWPRDAAMTDWGVVEHEAHEDHERGVWDGDIRDLRALRVPNLVRLSLARRLLVSPRRHEGETGRFQRPLPLFVMTGTRCRATWP